MTKTFIPLLLVTLFFILLLGGCSKDDTKGACIVGSGITAGCGDLTSNECNIMNGDEWHSGVTCAELGYGGNKMVSRLVVSEVFVADRKEELAGGWIELLNAGPDPVALAEFDLVLVDRAGRLVTVPLAGVLESCQTFVIGGGSSVARNGWPVFNQVDDFGNGGLGPDPETVFLGLFRSGERPGSDCPLVAVNLGNGEDRVYLDETCRENLSLVGAVMPGRSVQRTAWPADSWSSFPEPEPNLASGVVGCQTLGVRSPTGNHPVWR